jgi:CRISPR-associated Csh1 family protein
LITAIANLAKGWLEGEIAALVARTDAKYVIELKVRIGDNCGQYLGASLEENKGAERYLYGDSPHRPGLFVTGRLSQMYIQKVKKSVKVLNNKQATGESIKKAKNDIADFQRLKVSWISHGTILSSKDLMSMLPQPQRAALLSLKELVNKEIEHITNDVLKIIESFDPREGESGELLLTFKLKDNSKEYYVGDIPEYVSIFKHAMIRPKSLSKKKNGKTRCIICNKPSLQGTFEHPPLPFFTLDKPNFIPSGDPVLGYRVFPLCVNCYMNLRLGQAYIEQNLSFAIPNSKRKGSNLRFWLIPVLNNPSFVQDYLNNMNRGGLYLKNLKKLCETMEDVTRLDTESNAFEVFLSFTAVFYTIDKQGHMRLISSEQGIFPKRLRQVVEVKTQVDTLYPFRRENIRFGFPLLRDFIESPKTEGWYSQMALLLSSVFLGAELNSEFIYKLLGEKIREIASGKAELEAVKDIVLKALAMIDYLTNLGLLELPTESIQHMSTQINDYMVNDVRKFLDSHTKLLTTGTMRAVCAIGIAVGVLLQVQRKRLGRSMPFWGRLNRLEIDLDRARSFFPQVVAKLQQYDEHGYDQLLAFLGAEEVSKLDSVAKDLPMDLVSFVFAVGLSEGYMLSK